MLRLLATGAVDDTAALRLGTSERTIRRRLARLADQFGVQGRFALGVAVGRSGLIASRDPDTGMTQDRAPADRSGAPVGQGRRSTGLTGMGQTA